MAGHEGPPTDGRGARALTMLVAVALGLLAFGLVAWLLSLGEKGDHIAGPLSFGVGLAALVVSVLALRRGSPVQDDVGTERPPPRRWLVRSVAIASILLLGTGLGLNYFQFVRKPDLPITNKLVFEGHVNVEPGQVVTIRIPGNPPGRDHLAITPTLVNDRPVGDCVGSARLDVIPRLDGVNREPRTNLRPGRELRVELDGIQDEALLLVTVRMPDPTCVVSLGVREATLFN
ncbi:MAG TPA: hypothetical protein VGD67_17245 [Pseudonocardiaceae bacterium]